MKKNNIRTSKRVATLASELLKRSNTSSKAKSTAGCALGNRKKFIKKNP